MLTDKLTREIGKPFTAQMTVDSIWEEAVGTDLTDSSSRNMLAIMSRRTGRLALEVNYRLDSGRNVYFGFKHDTSFTQASTPRLFLDKLASLLSQVAVANFVTGVELLGSELIGNSNAFLRQAPKELELGVYNNWHSAGPCNIWQAGEPMPTKETLITKLEDHDVLLHNSLNYIGLEHIFEHPAEHWLSVEVSNTSDGEYILDQQFALQIAQLTFK